MPLAWAVLLLSLIPSVCSALQKPLQMNQNSWTVQLSSQWDVLGPFPIHAREQHFLSPSFPLNLSKQVDLDATWPSSYADGGSVSWTTAESDPNGVLEVSFPNIRWESLRATEGWAALQHHAVLRSTITLHPPQSSCEDDPIPRLLVDLIQGSYFTIMPITPGEDSHVTPKWYVGNIYAMERALPQAVDLPTAPSRHSPTQYHLFVSGDYEIRLFGDPHARDSKTPVQTIQISVTTELPAIDITHVPSHDVAPDFLEGFAFGGAFGVGVRSVDGWWSVTAISLKEPIDGVSATLRSYPRIAPSQTRIIPFNIKQDAPIDIKKLVVALTLTESNGRKKELIAEIPVENQHMWTSSTHTHLKGSYFFASSMPTMFYAIPPKHPHQEKFHPPLLALHGAGVDIFASTFWQDSLPRQERSWIAIPSGRTSWGLDWHGPSATDAWNALDALIRIVNSRADLAEWSMEEKSKAILLGHSNGGQGTWHLAVHSPGRVLAAIPAAAYMKSQAYVPLTMSRSARFLDPAKLAVLESALTPDNNDLFLSNIALIPVLAIHGGDDENVPTWHTRELTNVFKQWSPTGNITFHEDKDQLHWYRTVLDNDHVREFIDKVITDGPPSHLIPKEFVLTVAIPSQTQGLFGMYVRSLQTTGRLGKLHVRRNDGVTELHLSNINDVCVETIFGKDAIEVNGQRFEPLAEFQNSPQSFVKLHGSSRFTRRGCEDMLKKLQPGRLQGILSTTGPLNIIVSDSTSQSELSAAFRVAQSLDLYHKLDANVVCADKILGASFDSSVLSDGNSIVIGSPSDDFPKWLLAQRRTPLTFDDGTFSVNGFRFSSGSLGVISLHPGLKNPESSTALILYTGTDAQSVLERTLRLFPLRTGVAIPEWIVQDSTSDTIGAAGIVGAGIWNDEWSWNEAMSYIL